VGHLRGRNQMFLNSLDDGFSTAKVMISGRNFRVTVARMRWLRRYFEQSVAMAVPLRGWCRYV
jgi:hypothetical protein